MLTDPKFKGEKVSAEDLIDDDEDDFGWPLKL